MVRSHVPLLMLLAACVSSPEVDGTGLDPTASTPALGPQPTDPGRPAACGTQIGEPDACIDFDHLVVRTVNAEGFDVEAFLVMEQGGDRCEGPCPGMCVAPIYPGEWAVTATFDGRSETQQVELGDDDLRVCAGCCGEQVRVRELNFEF